MPPIVETKITQHTLWQALSGETPPLALPPVPISSAVLDSRDVQPSSLFVACAGHETDGHEYIAQAVGNGAIAVICEARGLPQATAAGALVVDCTQSERTVPALAGQRRRKSSPIAYIVDNSVAALQTLGAFQRLHRTHPQLRVIGITGSVGKTSTKELAASVLSQRYRTLHSQGNLNSEQGLPLTLLGLGLEDERAVLEMGMYALGEIRQLCRLARPDVGVVTNVGPSHLERLGTMERIAQAKTELVEALPSADEGGVAVLNWDDERVRPMAAQTQARLFRYGLAPEADLWADEIESAGLEGIRFRFHYKPADDDSSEKTLYARVPLLGRHSVHTALRAAAIGLVEGLGWPEIMAGLQRSTGQLRLVVVAGINGSTIIDDTYNASPASTLAALNLLDDLQNENGGRRVAVLGDMRELGSYTDEGHRTVGIRAAAVTEMIVTVGDLGRIIGEEALAAGFDPAHLHLMESAEQAIAVLRESIQSGDLVLVKGSRVVGMDHIVSEISQDEAAANADKEEE